MKRVPGGITYFDPVHQKQKSLNGARNEVRQMVSAWFSQHIPGFFCTSDGNKLPTAELLTTEKYRVLSSEDEHDHRRSFNWQRLLSNPGPFDVWCKGNCPGFQFVVERREVEGAFHLRAAARISDLPEDALRIRGGSEDRGAVVAYCHESLEGILTRYAALAFLRESSKDLKISRAALRIGSLPSGGLVGKAVALYSPFFPRGIGHEIEMEPLLIDDPDAGPAVLTAVRVVLHSVVDPSADVFRLVVCGVEVESKAE